MTGDFNAKVGEDNTGSESAMENMNLDLEMKTESGLLNFVLSTASSLAELYFSIRKSIK